MEKLSVLIPTFNNETLLPACLEQVQWADEIVVVDSFSRDATVEIARRFGARVIQREYVQSAKQKNWAIPQCANPWVLQLDTDEVPEASLREELLSVLENPPPDTDGYRIPFKHHVLGEWVKVCNLYPEYHLRLFRRDAGRFEDKEVHAHVVVPGGVGTMQNHILHYGMPSLAKQLTNIDRYSRYQADELRKRGKRFHWTQLTLRPAGVFFYYYVWTRGFTAGYRGLLISALNTTFDFWAHAKLWELEAMHLPVSPK